jgi:hypothetical protein
VICAPVKLALVDYSSKATPAARRLRSHRRRRAFVLP